MGTRSIDSLLAVDSCVRKAVQRLGERTAAAQHLKGAMRNLHRDVGGRALHDLSVTFDPKTELKEVFRAAEAAGLSWQDMVDALNHYHETNPRGPE